MKKLLVICILIAALMIAGVGACGNGTTTDATYKLTHSAADVEYILGWDFIVSQCPDIGDYDKIEGFVHRGETMQITPGETFFLDEIPRLHGQVHVSLGRNGQGKDFAVSVFI